MPRVYLDANATTPLDPGVREVMERHLDCGNASSPHGEGRAAREAIDRARDQVAALVGASPKEIVFTSGGTEANALALLGTMQARSASRVLCSAVEHPSVLRTLEALRPGGELIVAPVNADGAVDKDLEIPDGVGLVSVMRANNETGALQPVRAIAQRATAAGAVMHCDAVQACGKIPVDVGQLGVNLLSVSAHKLHGPKGVGALWIQRGAKLAPLYHGGEHERGYRAGTENVASIAGFGAAAEIALAELDARRALWERLTALLERELRASIADIRFNSPTERVANTLNVTIPDAEGEAVLLGLDLEGFAVGTGSACSSGATEPSHVLQAMGRSRTETEQSIRISMHAYNTEDDVIRFVNALSRVVKSLRELLV